MEWIFQRLIDRWMKSSPGGVALKTDLYDEAISTHNLISLFAQESEWIIGTDISLELVRTAKRRKAKYWNGSHYALVSDIRDMAFKANAFDRVLSHSTLDHFARKKDIAVALKELGRIIKSGGTLIITLDNPSNPLVFLRNLLPYRLLKSTGVINFYVGATLSKPEFIRILESNGFRVEDRTAIVHSPRILAIWVGKILDRIGDEGLKVFLSRILRIFEGLEKFPSRYWTGYFVAIKATKI